MKTNKFKLLASLLFIFGLSSCNILINVPITSSSNTNTNTTSSDTTPTEVPVTSLEVNPDVLALAIGETSVVEARCLPEGSNQKVTWKSSKMNVATVDPETGVITAVATGTTKIYATSVANTRVTGYCTLTVAEQIVRATNVSLDKHEVSLSLNGTTYLHGTITPTNATGGINWASSNESVVTVSSSGKLTAVGYGTATIRAVAASDNKIFDECAVTVQKISVTSVSLDKTSLTVPTGSQTTLTATVLPNNADDKSVTWSSSDTTVAYVDQTGVVRANKEGTATITVKSNEKPAISASCVFTVQDVHVTSVAMNKSKVSMSVDSSSELEVLFTPENASNKKVTWSSSDTSVATVGNISGATATVYSNALGKCNITATTEDGGLVATAEITVTTLGKTPNKYNYEDLTDHSIYAVDAIPSTGNPKVLVVPVWMTDSSSYIKTDAAKASIRSDIEKAYFGTNAETGWRSVKTYYEEESFGRLHLNGVVTDWYSCGYKSSSCSGDNTTSIVSNVWSWFKTNNPSTYRDYDTNGDGYVDSIVLIYAAPDYQTSRSSNDNLWAYCYWMQQNPGTSTNPVPNVFFWASYDFMYSRSDANSGGYGGGDTSHCNLDTHTFIHEMGHIFGLNDYYDYNGGYSASAGFSMQDYNVGGHDPFSKMALDWIEPYAPKDSITINIKPLESDGDVILLSPNYTGSAFDEYIMIELYAPVGLNKFDSDYKYENSYPQGPSSAGCRVWHVDSRLASYNTSTRSFVLETNPSISNTKYYTNAFTNSTWKSSSDGRGSILASSSTDAYAKYRQLQLIRKNYTTDEKCGDMLNSNALFKTGDTFDMTTYKNCFVNKGKLNNGNNLGFSVHFDQVSSTGATITITKV